MGSRVKTSKQTQHHDPVADVTTLIKKLAAGSAAAALKGQQLDSMCRALSALFEDSQRTKRYLSPAAFSALAEGLLLLLSKVLLGRKRLRDWKQQEHSSKVCALLAAATAMMAQPDGATLSDLRNRTAAVAAHLDAAQTLHAIDTVQSEVAQLLHTCSQQQQQQQQQQQPEALLQLQKLACELLMFWNDAQIIWSAHADFSRGGAPGPFSFLQPAVDLAAVLAQTLTGVSPLSHFIAVAKATCRCACRTVLTLGFGF
jgi:hypothetical protein